MTVTERIDAQIASRRLLDHPFYTTWSCGKLSHHALQRYAEQYYQWVAAFPTFLSATHANCESLAMRQAILENLIDEERGPGSHLELWLRFCEALDLRRNAVLACDPDPETQAAIRVYKMLCGERPPVAALAAIYAYESQQPAVAASKRAGLSSHYGVTTGHDYFTLHETIDIEHSGTERRIIEASAAGHERVIEESVTQGLDATYTLLDGIYARYC